MAKISTLRDNFNSATIDDFIWNQYAQGGASIGQSGGKLVIQPVTSTATPYAGIVSVYTYDLNDSQVFMQVDSVSSLAMYVDNYLLMYSNDQMYSILMNVANGRIYMDITINGARTSSYITYISGVHKWWRVRKDSTYVFWETSADGDNWTVRRSKTAVPVLPDMFVELAAGTYREVSTLSSFTVDNFNTEIIKPEAKGTLVIYGESDPIATYKREATGTLMFSGNVFGFRKTSAATLDKKDFMYKVYDEDGNFRGVLDDVISEPQFSEEINQAGSTMDLLLARNSDSRVISTAPLLDDDSLNITDASGFQILTAQESKNKIGVGSNIAHNYRVDTYVFYGEVSAIQDSMRMPITDSNGETIDGTIGAPNGVRKFSGFISEINRQYGEEEATQVQLMSYGYDLDQYVIETATQDTTVPYNSFDPGAIVRDAMDKFIAQSSPDSYTSYLSSTVSDTGTVVSYTFRNNTFLEVLQKSIELAPTDWFFHVDLGSNLVRYQAKPSTANHTFYLGKHIKSLALRTYIGDVVNDVIFTGGQQVEGDENSVLFKRYTRPVLAGTRRGLSRNSDNRVKLATSADTLSQGELDAKQNMQYRSTVEIIAGIYDIESVKIGDVVAFRNFDNEVDKLQMQVVALNYTPDVLTMQLDTLPDSTNKRLEDLKRNLNLQENQNVPNKPL